jgi:branched-chain amino acid aminotransferase
MVWNPFESDRETCVSINGELHPPEEATVSVFDRNFLYGDGVFDSMPIHDGDVILFDRHVDRLFRSAKGIQLELIQTKAELKSELMRTAARSGVEYGALRVMISRGAGPPGIVNADRVPEPTVVIVPIPKPPEDVAYAHDTPSTGDARIVSTRAISPDSIDSKIKSCNYLINALAERELAGTDADFGIMLDHDGYVAEEFVSNVFVRDEDGAIRTPPPTHALNGITRQLLIEVGREEGYEISETRLTPYDLYSATDVFLTASARGISSVSTINDQQIGDGEPSGAVIDLSRAALEHALEHAATPIE